MHGIARFATFELNLRTGELRNRGIRLRLRRQSAEILGMLIERLGEVVARDEIRDKLWPGGTIVEFDHSVNSAVNRLRDVLGDSRSAPRFVETLPRVGYRFVGAVEIELPARGEPAPAAATARVEPLAVPSPERRLSRKTWTGAALLATGILLAAAMIAARHRLAPSSAANARSTIRSVAVLPLTNLPSNPDEDYFAEGVTEELLTELAHIDAWRVISRTSVMRYKGTRKGLPEIARELGVDAVIEGTLQRLDGRIRITAQLIEAATDTHLWAGSFERDMSNALTVQREIAQSIAQAVRVKVQGQQRLPPSLARSVVPEAYEAYLRGRYFMNRAEYPNAGAWLDRAVAKDPGLAAAYALLYEADAMTAYQRDLPLPPRTLRALELARSLDPALADVHTDAGDVAFCWDWNWNAAEAEFRRAVQIDPGSVEAVAHYALYFVALARWELASEWCRRLRERSRPAPRCFRCGSISIPVGTSSRRTNLEKSLSWIRILLPHTSRPASFSSGRAGRRMSWPPISTCSGSASETPICRRFAIRRAKEESAVTGENKSNSCGGRQNRRGFLPWTSQWHMSGWATKTEPWKGWRRHTGSTPPD